MREKAYRINVPQNDISGIDLLQFWMSSSEVQQIVNRVQQNYLSWDEFKYKSWARADKEKIWAIVRLFRQTQFVDTPIKDFSGSVYKYTPGHYLKFLHEIDLETGGNFMGIDDFSEFDKKRFIRRNLIEESIASSQLEGANTSREVAKKLLRDGTAPRNKGEQMIVNNYAALRAIERELKNEPLSIELLMNLHRIVTANTLSEEYQGRLRNTLDKNGNKLVIKPWDDEIVAYEAPSKEFVERELPRLVDFANHEDSSQFIHPLIKAILLHFWIGILHPFEDGNGRLARIIFYWYMLRKGYWAFSYLSLSERLLTSPTQYAMAYIYSEQDGYDLNYFIQYNIDKLELAKRQFKEYLKQKMDENINSMALVKTGYHFNRRQLNLLQYLLKNEQRYTTLKTHLEINDSIKKVTAIQDLSYLVKEGLLTKTRMGRQFLYHPTAKVIKLFNR